MKELRMKWRRFYDVNTDAGTGSDDQTTIEVGDETVDVDVIHAKAEEVIKKEKEAKPTPKPEPKVETKVDSNKEELLQRALERIEALEQKNSDLERTSILDKFDSKALEGLKEKGVDISTYSNEELAKTATLMSAMGVTTKAPTVKHNVNPSDDISTGEDFMKLWNKAKGRK